MGKVSVDIRNMRRLLSYVLHYKFAIFMVVFWMIIFSASMFGKIKLIQNLMDDVLAPVVKDKGIVKAVSAGSVTKVLETGNEDETPEQKRKREEAERKYLESRMTPLMWIVLITLILAVTSAVSHFGKEYFRRYLMHRVVVDIRNQVGAHILTLSLDFHQERRGGDIINRMTNDLQVTMRALQFMLGDVLQAPFMILAGIAFAFWLSWQLATVTFVIFPFLLFILLRYGRRIRKHSKQSLERLADVTEHMMQMFSGIRIVKAFALEDYEKRDFHDANERYFGRAMKVVRDKALAKCFLELFNNVCVIVLVAIGAYLVIKGVSGITLGVLAAFVGIMGGLSQPIRNATHAFTELSESVAGSERVFHILELEPTIKDADDAKTLLDIRESIRFENVSFQYDENTPLVLRDINFTAEVGKVYAFVGKTGAGKSTLLDLIPRFYEPTGGSIKFDGVDYHRYTRKSILDQIAIVSQHPFLFNTTIKDNIRMGRLDADDDRIFAAAGAAHVEGFVQKKPDGYDTVVGERGENLSGGERQRVTIARAILKDASILILDEATSSLDSASEKLVQDALDNLMQDRTTFVVAHRLSTIQRADSIFVIDNNTIAESGTHEELLARGGIYSDLYKQQFNINDDEDSTPDGKKED